MASTEPSIVAVFKWYRRRLTDNKPAHDPAVIVATESSGWVLPGPGEPVDRDGCRPLGAVRDLLDDAILRARPLTIQQRLAVRALYGLMGYPRSHTAMGARMPQERRRPGPGVGPAQLTKLAAQAIAVLDASGAAHWPGPQAVAAGLVPEPIGSRWCPQVPRAEQFERVIAEALAFATAAGTDDHTALVVAEVLAYRAGRRARGWTKENQAKDGEVVDRRVVGTSRARALVSLALWRHTAQRRRALPTLVDPPDTGIATLGTTALATSSDAVGRVLAGDLSGTVISEATSLAVRQIQDEREMANAVIDVLLARLRPSNRKRIPADDEAAILRAAVRVRSHDYDPTAIALALHAAGAHPQHWLTVDALQAAVKVASAFELWDLADTLCNQVDAIVFNADFVVPPGRAPHVEQVEYHMWTLHQRTATMRRRLDRGKGGYRVYERAMTDSSAAFEALEAAQARRGADPPGDVNDRWEYYLEVRSAELQLAAHRLAAAEDPHSPMSYLIGAERNIVRAERVADATELDPLSRMPTIKTRLDLAYAREDFEQAIELVQRIHTLGWPLTRSVPPIVHLSTRDRARDGEWLGNQPPNFRQLVAAIDELTIIQSQPSWRGAADDRTRNRRRNR